VRVQDSADEAWSALTGPWQEALKVAWESFRDGGIAVGTVLISGTGDVIGRGRNQRFGSVPRGLLAHAEMQALTTLPSGKNRPLGLAMYTTLHPCPMCLGAVVIARVSQLHFAAYDPTWLGIERLPELNDEVRRRWPSVTGPLKGLVGEWAAVLPCLNTSGSLVRAMESVAPRRADLARAIASRLARDADPPDSANAALGRVWDLLTDHVRRMRDDPD
jgi:tRNA(Arg) A34 adenosine deaminase TadA